MLSSPSFRISANLDLDTVLRETSEITTPFSGEAPSLARHPLSQRNGLEAPAARRHQGPEARRRLPVGPRQARPSINVLHSLEDG